MRQLINTKSLSFLACLAFSVSILPGQAKAQASWPDRPVKLIVPFAPGASTDSVARLLAGKLSARLGQQVVVENRSGGGGSIGIHAVAKSAADGYTLLFASSTVITTAATGKKLPYDPIKDLTPIGETGSVPFLIVVPTSSSATTLSELIAQARAKPGALSYGTGGVATIEMKTSFMQPAVGVLVAKGQLMHRTATMAFTQSTIFDAQGRACASAMGTFKFLKRPPGTTNALSGAGRTGPAATISTD